MACSSVRVSASSRPAVTLTCDTAGVAAIVAGGAPMGTGITAELAANEVEIRWAMARIDDLSLWSIAFRIAFALSTASAYGLDGSSKMRASMNVSVTFA